MKEYYRDLGKRIKNFRKQYRLTVKEVSQILEIGPSTYRAYEMALSRIPVDKLHILSKFYGINILLLLPQIESNIISLNNKIMSKDELASSLNPKKEA